MEGAGDGWGMGMERLSLVTVEDLGIRLSPSASAQAAQLAARGHYLRDVDKRLMQVGGDGW